MAAELAALGLLLLGGLAPAQEAASHSPSPYSTWPPSAQIEQPQSVPPSAVVGTPVPAEPVGPIQPAAYQIGPRPLGTTSDVTDSANAYEIQLEPPGLERLSTVVQSDSELQERIRQENRTRNPMERITFPEEPILSRDTYQGRGPIWPERTELVAPNYVCYKRLLFEQKNMERYGWDLGPLAPIISAATFYADVVTLPYHLATDPCRCYECSTGYCLPGDPVPLLLYPPEISLTGAVAEAGTILALVAIFP